VEKLRYMHRNPVARGLVERPEDWAWSSFLHYLTGAEGVVEIESQWRARRREKMGAPVRVRQRIPTRAKPAWAPRRVKMRVGWAKSLLCRVPCQHLLGVVVLHLGLIAQDLIIGGFQELLTTVAKL